MRELILRDLWAHDGRLSAAKLRSPAYAGIVRRRLRCAGAVALLLSPLSLLLAALFYGSHALGDVKSSGSYLGPRIWTLRALRLFRGYNELPHALQRRLAPSFSLASRFLAASAGVQSPLAPVVARFALVLAGGFLAYLALLGLLDETILTHTTLLGRNLIWYAAIVGAIAGVARSFATDTDGSDGSAAAAAAAGSTSMSMSQSGSKNTAAEAAAAHHALSRSAAYGKGGAGVMVRHAAPASTALDPQGSSVPAATTASEDLLRQLALHTHYLPQDWTWSDGAADERGTSGHGGRGASEGVAAVPGMRQSSYGSAAADYHAVSAPAAPLAALSSAQRRWQTVQRARSALHQLFQFRLLVALGEVAGALLVPLLLLLVLPGRVPDLLRFVATHAINEPLPRFRSFKRAPRAHSRAHHARNDGAAHRASDTAHGSGSAGSDRDSDVSRSSLASSRSGSIGGPGQGALGLGDICCYGSLTWRPPRADFLGGIRTSESDAAVVIGPAQSTQSAADAAAVSALRKWQRSALAFAAEHPSSGSTSAALRGVGAGAAAPAERDATAGDAAHLAVRRRRKSRTFVHRDSQSAAHSLPRPTSQSARDDDIERTLAPLPGGPGQLQAAAEAQLAASVLGGWAFETAASASPRAATQAASGSGDLPLTNPSVREVRQWRSIMVDGLQRAAAIPETSYL